MQRLDVLQCLLLLLIRLDCSELDELSRAKIKKSEIQRSCFFLKQVFLKYKVLEKEINENNVILCNYF